MKIELTVTSERPKSPIHFNHRSDVEKYVSAVMDVEGDPRLIADSLRALADSIWLPESIEWQDISA